MLDIKLVREQPDKVREAFRNRNESPENVDKVLQWDENRRALLVEKEKLQARRNELSKQVPAAKDPQQRAALIEESKASARASAELDQQTDEVEGSCARLCPAHPQHPAARPRPSARTRAITWLCAPGVSLGSLTSRPLPHWDLGDKAPEPGRLRPRRLR